MFDENFNKISRINFLVAKVFSAWQQIAIVTTRRESFFGVYALGKFIEH